MSGKLLNAINLKPPRRSSFTSLTRLLSSFQFPPSPYIVLSSHAFCFVNCMQTSKIETSVAYFEGAAFKGLKAAADVASVTQAVCWVEIRRSSRSGESDHLDFFSFLKKYMFNRLSNELPLNLVMIHTISQMHFNHALNIITVALWNCEQSAPLQYLLWSKEAKRCRTFPRGCTLYVQHSGNQAGGATERKSKASWVVSAGAFTLEAFRFPGNHDH